MSIVIGSDVLKKKEKKGGQCLDGSSPSAQVHCVSSVLAWTIIAEALSEDLQSSSRTVSMAGSFLASQALLHSANLLEVLHLTNASMSFSIPLLPVFLWKPPRPSKTNKHWSSSRGGRAGVTQCEDEAVKTFSRLTANDDDVSSWSSIIRWPVVICTAKYQKKKEGRRAIACIESLKSSIKLQ